MNNRKIIQGNSCDAEVWYNEQPNPGKTNLAQPRPTHPDKDNTTQLKTLSFHLEQLDSKPTQLGFHSKTSQIYLNTSRIQLTTIIVQTITSIVQNPKQHGSN